MTDTEDDSEQKTTHRLRANKIPDRTSESHVHIHHGEIASPVKDQTCHLKRHVFDGTERLAEDIIDRRVAPGETCDHQDGEVSDGLNADEKLIDGTGRGEVVLCCDLARPCEDWGGIDVGIDVVQVGYGMMSVVLVLPPGEGESLPHISDHQPDAVAINSILEDLMMNKVVRQPSALLPEERKHTGRESVHGEAIEGHDEIEGKEKDSKRR